MTLDLSKISRVLFIDAHYPEWDAAQGEMFVRWSPVQIIEAAINCGAQAFSFFAKDHFGNCYYPTNVGHRHREVTEDFTGQIVAEARKQGIPIIIYYSAFADDYVFHKFPDWRTHHPNIENPPKPRSWGNVGFHQAYMDKMFLPQIREICAWYKPDGLFLDTMGDAEPCECPECRARFKRIVGREMDLNALEINPRPWQTTKTDALIDLYGQVKRTVREIVPEAKLIFGAYSDDPDARKDWVGVSDLDLYETTTHWVGKHSGYLNSGISARYFRTKPTPIMAGHYCFIGCWGELATKPAATIETEFLNTRAHGITVMASDYLRPWGRLEPETFRRVKRVFDKVQALDPWTMGAKALKHTALLDYGGLNWLEHTVGAARALTEGHVQYDIIDETDLEEMVANPSFYKVLVVPAPQPLWKPERWKLLAEWIKKGGHAIIEGSELMAGEASCLCPALGIEEIQPSEYSAYYVKLDGSLSIADAPETPLLVHERPMRFKLRGAEPLCALMDPFDEWDPSKGIVHRTSFLPPKRTTNGFAMTIHQYGAGKAVFIAGSYARAYFCHTHVWIRDMLLEALRRLSPNPVQVDAPPWVETNVMEHEGRIVLHMVQFCLSPGSGSEESFWHGDHTHMIEESRPLFDIAFRLKVDKKPTAVYTIPDRTSVKFEYLDGVVSSALPRLDIHAAICIEF